MPIIQSIVNIISNTCETKHYAFIVPHGGDKIIVKATNVPVSYYGLPSKHAEHHVINKFLRLKNKPKLIDLVVVRLSKTGKLGQSKPCFHCLLRINSSGLKIKNIYYSLSDGTIKCEKLCNIQCTQLSTGYKKAK